MFSKQANIAGYSNRFFQFRFAQEKFRENQCLFLERVECVKLQFEHMDKMIITKAQVENEQVREAKKQFQQMEKFSKVLRASATQCLLKKQTQLQQQAQRRDITKQYEQRITQLDSVVYSKQVDISADHVGKPQSQKPTEEKVNKLSNLKNQLNFTMSFLQRISSMRKKIKELQKAIPQAHFCGSKQKQLLIPLQDSIEKDSCFKTESAITKQSSSSQSSQSNPEIERRKYKKVRKMLLLNTQSKIYDRYNKQFDPQMIKINQFLKKQKIRQAKLLQQYKKLRQKFGELSKQNKSLSDEYLKIPSKYTKNNEPNHSLIVNNSSIMVDA